MTKKIITLDMLKIYHILKYKKKTYIIQHKHHEITRKNMLKMTMYSIARNQTFKKKHSNIIYHHNHQEH